MADCIGDKRALFRLVGDLTGSTAPQLLPDRPCLQDTADDLGAFFASKISTIRSNLDRAADSGSPSDALPPEQSFLCQHKDTDLLRLRTVSTEEVIKLIGSLPAKSCPLTQTVSIGPHCPDYRDRQPVLSTRIVPSFS